jgi:hypothetical protein
MFKRLISLSLVCFVFVSLASAQLFDSIGGTLKDANLGGTLGGGVAPVDPNAPVADLSFTPNGQRLINAEFDKLAGTLPDATPEQLGQFKQVIDQLLTAIDAEVVKLGENPHDMGTAVAAFFELAYFSYNNLDPAKEPSDAQGLAAIKQFRSLLSSNPKLLEMNNDQRQLFYEAAIGIPALFVAFQQYATEQGDTAGAEQWRTQVISLFKSTSGLDIAQVQYTEQGVVVAGTGAAPQTQTPQGDTTQATTPQATTPQATTPTATTPTATTPQATTPQATTPLSPEMQAQLDSMTPEQLQEMLPDCQTLVANSAAVAQSEEGKQSLALCQAIVAKAGGTATPATATPATNTPATPEQTPPAEQPTTGTANPLNPLGGNAADPFVGNFSGDNIALVLQGSNNTYTGELNFNNQPFPVQATGDGTNLTGTFTSGTNTFNFTATLQDKALTLVSDGSTFNLTKQ